MAHRTRREAGRVTLAWRIGVVLLIAGVGCRAWAQTPPESRPDQPDDESAQRIRIRPNIVIFLIDTLRADHVGVYGYDRRPTTPNIDALARESVVFDQAYAPAPWTLPSVVSLVTSTFPREHGTLHDHQKLSKSLMPLAQRLQRFHYNTLGLIANSFAGRDYGLDRGFEVLQESPRNNGQKVERLLNTYPGEPFYLYIHNIEPHTPYHFAPAHTDGFPDIPDSTRSKIARRHQKYQAESRVDFTNNRPVGTTDNTDEQARHLAVLTRLRDDYDELYDASVHLADSMAGSVIDALKERGVWENTLFILLSDHGEEFGEHGGWFHDQSVYEEQLRVPLFIHFPHEQYAGQRIRSVVSLVDIMPTIFGYMAKPNAAQHTHGRDLMPLIRGDEPDASDEFYVPAMRMNVKKYYRPWKESRGDINVVVRKGTWKGIWNVEPDTLELYDLSSDPHEQRDVAKSNPALALAMQAFARVWYENCGKNAAAPPERADAPDEETLRNLRLLGYVD
jgi:arylsulfatase A-like enzyme